jgi:drug/metabolite transporter (DMT)-like permease
MFKYNDMALIHVFWGLSTPVTAVLAWFFLKEDLGMASYAGMAIIVVGAVLLSFSKKSLKCNLASFSLMMIPLVVFYSLSEVVMKHVEEGLHGDFWATFPWVCVGQVIFGLILLAVRYKKVKEEKLFQRITNAKNRNLFVISEMFELLGTFFMMLSIAKTPSVTYFAVMDSFLPLMVIILTGITGSVMILLGKSKSLSVVFKENHLAGIVAKVAAIMMMAFGVYVMSYSSQDAMNIINDLSQVDWQKMIEYAERFFIVDDLVRFFIGLLG